MGHNLDLIQMFGMPPKTLCPHCNNMVECGFDEYDIDCGSPNENPGKWELSCYCPTCSHEWKKRFKIKLVYWKEK